MSPFRSSLAAALLSVSFVACVSETEAPLGPSDDGSGGKADSPTEPFAARATRASAVVQLFDWPYREVTPSLCALRDDGFSHVHVSPPQASNSSGSWWGRYQPVDLREISGPLGDEGEFRAMVDEARRCDIAIVADLVLNHAANLGLSSDELYFPIGCDRTDDSSCLWRPDYFHNEECITDYGNHCAVLYGRICGGGGDRGLPDLNTGHCEPGGVLNTESRNYDPRVLAAAKTYVSWLQSMGVRAFRLDAAKHMHPAFLRDLFGDRDIAPALDWHYGEVITDRAEDASLRAYAELPNMDYMDFPLARSMQQGFAFGGSLRGLENAERTGRALPASQAVAFVTNHDVWGNADGLGYRFGGTESFQDELLAHMFIMGRASGIPYVFSELEGRSESARYRSDGTTYVRFHERAEVRLMVRFHAFSLGENERWIAADDDHVLIARGDRGLVAINKSSEPWSIDHLALGLPDGVYNDLFGRRVEVRGGHTTDDVPARWGWLALSR
jgi:alpha-amylase